DSVGNRWRPAATTLSGSPTILPNTMTTNLTISGTTVQPHDITLTGNLTVSGTGASLNINDHRFDVSGNFQTTAGGVLRMIECDCNHYLFVGGNVTFDGGNTEGL